MNQQKTGIARHDSKMPVAKEKWYARPIFSVSNLDVSLHYYCKILGFRQDWKYEEDGKMLVAQVSRGEFEVILTGNFDRVGAGRVFISLSESEMNSLEYEIKEKDIAFDEIRWGYPAIRCKDPDGNELIFPRETEV